MKVRIFLMMIVVCSHCFGAAAKEDYATWAEGVRVRVATASKVLDEYVAKKKSGDEVLVRLPIARAIYDEVYNIFHYGEMVSAEMAYLQLMNRVRAQDLRERFIVLDNLAKATNDADSFRIYSRALASKDFTMVKTLFAKYVDDVCKMPMLVADAQRKLIDVGLEKMSGSPAKGKACENSLAQQFIDEERIDVGALKIGVVQTKNGIDVIKLKPNVIAFQLPVNRQTGAQCGSNALVNAEILCKNNTVGEVLAQLKDESQKKEVEKSANDLTYSRITKGAGTGLAEYYISYPPERLDKNWMALAEIQYQLFKRARGGATAGGEYRQLISLKGVNCYLEFARDNLFRITEPPDIALGEPVVFIFGFKSYHTYAFRVELLEDGVIALLIADSLGIWRTHPQALDILLGGVVDRLARKVCGLLNTNLYKMKSDFNMKMLLSEEELFTQFCKK